jgi:hypothetical protein
MQKWEYLILKEEFKANKDKWEWTDGDTQKTTDRLKTMGREGWELIDVAPQIGRFGTDAYSYYFKRPIE